MSDETRVPIPIKTHSNTSNNFIQPPGNGIDTIRVTFSKPFTRYTLDLLTPGGVSGCEVISSPKRGARGDQRFRIKWYYFPYGKVTYRLNVYSGKPQPLTIRVDSHNWANKVNDAINQKLEVNLVIGGLQARNLYRQILMMVPSDEIYVPADLFFEPEDDMVNEDEIRVSDVFEVEETPSGPMAEPVSGTVVITLGIVAGLIVISGFATLAGILMMAMHKGYTVEMAELAAKTRVGDFEINVKLTP